MTNEEKLLSLLQPKNYNSKIKLFCNKCKFEVNKFADVKKESYICRVKIEEI
jgi:hypothetical protein